MRKILGEGKVLYLDFGGDCIMHGQNSQNCTLKMSTLYYV